MLFKIKIEYCLFYCFFTILRLKVVSDKGKTKSILKWNLKSSKNK